MKKKFMASLLSMLLVFSTMPTITYATEIDVETVAAEAETKEETVAVVAETEEETAVVETGTKEQTAADESGTDGEADISTGEITESQENPDTETPEETEEATEELSNEEEAVMSLESEETTPLLGSTFFVAATDTGTETETDEESEPLCDHGYSAASCSVCDVEEQIAALPTLEEIQTMTGDEEEAVYAQASALADVYYDDLTEDEQAQVSNIDTLWDVLDYFSSGLTLTALTAVSADTSWYNDTDTSFTITTALPS